MVVLHKSFGKLEKVVLVDERTKDFASIIPGFGANVNELFLKGRSIILGDKTAAELMKNKWFRSAKLCPFPNRIKNGRYKFNGKLYQLAINHPPNAIHGLVFNKKFIIAGKTKDSVTLRYEYHKENEGYPFDFSVQITYKLENNRLVCETIVKNIGDKPMPFGDGWHPYFRIGNKVDDLKLTIPSKKVIMTDEMIPNGKLKDFKFLQRIGKTNFDTGYVTKGKDTVLESKDYKITIFQKNYPYLQVFIPSGRKSIAIEPMTCITDAYNNHVGLIILKPGQKWKGMYGVK